MTNILKEQQQANKELLEENEIIKKQLADKEENLKVKIWHITGQSFDKDGNVSMYAPTGTYWYKKLKSITDDIKQEQLDNKLTNIERLEDWEERFINQTEQLCFKLKKI